MTKIDLSNPQHEVEKIPDFILLNIANARIVELKQEIQFMTQEFAKMYKPIKAENTKARFAAKSEEVYQRQQELVESLKTEIESLKKQNENLHIEVKEIVGENVCLKIKLGISTTTNLNKGIHNH